MIITPSNYYRARQILREWRNRGVKYIRLYYGDNGSIKNGYCCEPSDSDVSVNAGDKFFSVPPHNELPDSDAEYKDKALMTEAESWMASAISDFWDDLSVPREAAKTE